MTREPMRQLSSSQASVNSKIPQHVAKTRPLAAANRAVVTRTVNRTASVREAPASCGRTLVRKAPPRPVPEAAPATQDPAEQDGKGKKDAIMVAVRFRPLRYGAGHSLDGGGVEGGGELPGLVLCEGAMR